MKLQWMKKNSVSDITHVASSKFVCLCKGLAILYIEICFKMVHIKLQKIPVIIMAPSTGKWLLSSSVSVLLNIAGVEANLHICIIYCQNWISVFLFWAVRLLGNEVMRKLSKQRSYWNHFVWLELFIVDSKELMCEIYQGKNPHDEGVGI